MTMLRLQQISRDAYATWFDQNYNSLQQRSPYHHPLWLDAVEEGMQLRVLFLAIYAEGILIGVLPGFLTSRGPFRLFGSPLRGTHTSHLGPAMLKSCSGPVLTQIIQACSDYVRKHWRVQYTEFVVAEPPVAPHACVTAGWMHEAKGSYSLDLRRGQEAIWSGLTQRARRMIRKSERAGLTIRSLHDAEQYWGMLDQTFARRGIVPTHPQRFFRVVFARLVPQGWVWAWGTEHSGRVIAGGLFLHDDREAAYVSGASLTKYRALPTSYLLHWHAISAAVDLHLQKYDFVGRGMIPSIDEFKKSFNPSAVEYTSSCWSAGYVRLAKNTYLSLLPCLRRIQRWQRSVPFIPA